MTLYRRFLKQIADYPHFYHYLLCAVWCLSVILGAVTADGMQASFLLLFQNIGKTSAFGLLISLILPFLLSAYIVFRSNFKLLYLVCFLKAVLFGFCHYGTYLAFGSAGWLVRFLLFFSDSLSCVVLIYFWIRNIAGKSSLFCSEICCCLLILFVIFCVDIMYVTPFINTLTFS